MRKHLQVYHAAQEHGIQQVADEKLRFLNISPANRININDPTHDALSKKTLRVNAAWTEADFQKMLVQRSLLPGNAFTDWEHFPDTVRCQGETQIAYGLHASFL